MIQDIFILVSFFYVLTLISIWIGQGFRRRNGIILSFPEFLDKLKNNPILFGVVAILGGYLAYYL